MSARDLINQDFKTYNVGNHQLGISQVFTMDFNKIDDNISEYIELLNDMSKNYICIVFVITDVYRNGSYVLYNDSSKEIVMDAFDLKDAYEGVYIDNLVSRKIQILPALLEEIEKKV